MGRKRTSNKRNLNLWVDKDLVDQLNRLELNSSALFTDAAIEVLRKIKNGEVEIKENLSENDEE